MGIKGLSKFLRSKFPNLFHTISLSSFAYKLIAIDITLYIYKYKAIYMDNWLSSFCNFLLCLKKNKIHPVFIFDGTPPIEKTNERKIRQDRKDQLLAKIQEIELDLKNYHLTGEVSPSLMTLADNNTKKLLGSKAFSLVSAERELYRLKAQVVHITSEDYTNIMSLLSCLGLGTIKANDEAEKLCAELCITEQVYGVISDDTDVLVYGTPRFLTKVNLQNNTCELVEYKELLAEMKMTREQFTDLCIMCGTDYNQNIYKIGPQKAYKLLLEYKDIEKIPKIDISILNHIRGRELFKVNKDSKYNIGYSKEPDFKRLKEVLEEINNACVEYYERLLIVYGTTELEFVED